MVQLTDIVVIIRHLSFAVSGAPNENIVQNHLNIELLNVFYYLNGRYGIFLSPKNFSICSDFLAESQVIRKL